MTNITSGSVENLTYNYPAGANNGKIGSMYNAVSGETITYTYDSLNRLSTASDCTNVSGCPPGTVQWAEQYTFDPFGNLTTKNVTGGSGPSLSQAVNANNQIVGGSYDANGNTTSTVNSGVTYGLAYDPENRLQYLAGGGEVLYYTYDAQNRRTWSWPGTQDSLNNTTSYTVNAYTPSGQKLGAYLFVPATTTNGGAIVPILQVTLTSTDKYFGARRLATIDQLGSNVASSGSSFFPWGEAKGGYNPQDTWNFATYWQDSTTGLDYANNRYYSNAYGRFMTPDPYQSSVGPADPGSWNRYAYTRGDPANRNDPAGLCDSDDPSCLPTCDPADPICVVANECDPSDASCSLGVSYGETGGYPNIGQWAVTLQLGPTQLLQMVEDGFIQANPATIEAIEAGVSEAITLGGAALAALGEALQNFFAKSSWKAGSMPTVAEVEANCSPVGDPVKVPSTKRGNIDGGISVEQEYLCPDGKNYTIHTVFDKNGNVILQPHVRAGGPRYGR